MFLLIFNAILVNPIGHYCERKVELCHNSPCQNGGACSVRTKTENRQKVETRVCSCLPGFYGEFCNMTGSPCHNNPCMHGGSCRMTTGNNFACECPRGTEGRMCETDRRTDCSLQPCLNKGICKQTNYGYTCQCPASWRGKNCEVSHYALKVRSRSLLLPL